MKPSEQEEYKRAVQARNGDLDALSELVERLRLRLFAIAYAELQHYEDAQDAVASALVRICSHMGDLRDTGGFRAWVYTIVRNEARSLQRQRILASSHLSLSDVSELPAPSELSALRLDVEQALRRLPADQAHVLALFYLGNVPIRDIAQRVGRPEGTIKSWLHHGRRQLAQSMPEYAPMTMAQPTEWTAAILSDRLEPSVINSLLDALRAAGYCRIHRFHDCREILPEGSMNVSELHLPDALRGTHFLVLDHHIGTQSAFELHLILRAAEKEDNIQMAHCILLNPASDISVVASWLAGFDLALSQPVNPEEFERFARRIRESVVSQPG